MGTSGRHGRWARPRGTSVAQVTSRSFSSVRFRDESDKQGYRAGLENLLLRYSDSASADERRRNVDVKFPGPFEFEGREWVAQSVEQDGFTLCLEHERTFEVRLEGARYLHTGPLPADGEIITLEAGPRVRVSAVAIAHHDVRRGSFRAERIDG
jgi:hypothetical protein